MMLPSDYGGACGCKVVQKGQSYGGPITEELAKYRSITKGVDDSVQESIKTQQMVQILAVVGTVTAALVGIGAVQYIKSKKK